MSTVMPRAALTGLFFAISALLPVAGHAQQSAESERDFSLDDEWSIAVAPYIWATSLDGNAAVAGIKGDVDVGFDDILKDLSLAGMGYIDVRKRDYGFFINPLFARTEPSNNGKLFDTDVVSDMAVVSAGGFFRAATFELAETRDGFQRHAGIEPTAGVRWTYLRLELEADGPLGFNKQWDQSEAWLDSFVGVRTFAELGRNWLLTLNGDVGGFFNDDIDKSWNVSSFLTYRTTLFGATTNIGIGYRAFHQEYENGNGFRWDVTMHGPVLGTSFRF